jgi:hypothetical protein
MTAPATANVFVIEELGEDALTLRDGAGARQEAYTQKMRDLIRARDETHRLSIQLALEANGIPFTTNAISMGSAGYLWPTQFWVVNDGDYDRAREIVLELDVSS